MTNVHSSSSSLLWAWDLKHVQWSQCMLCTQRWDRQWRVWTSRLRNTEKWSCILLHSAFFCMLNWAGSVGEELPGSTMAWMYMEHSIVTAGLTHATHVSAVWLGVACARNKCVKWFRTAKEHFFYFFYSTSNQRGMETKTFFKIQHQISGAWKNKLFFKFNIKSAGHERTKTVVKIQNQISRAWKK